MITSLNLKVSFTAKNEDRGMCFRLLLPQMTLFSRATVQTKNLINYSFEGPVPKKPCEQNFLNHSSAIPSKFTLLFVITGFIFTCSIRPLICSATYLE